MKDPTLGIDGVSLCYNSKRLEFESSYACWAWVVAYCKKNKYKLRLNKPLSKKIYDQLRGVISPKAVSSRELYNAVGFHVHSIKYLKRMYPGVERLNLWGKPDGTVTEQEAQHARKKLTELHPEYLRAKRKSKSRGIINNPKIKGDVPKKEGNKKRVLRFGKKKE